MVGMPVAAVHRHGMLRAIHARFPKASATKLGHARGAAGAAKPPSWQGSGQARVPIAIQVPSGIGGSGRGYPWQTGMTSGWGPHDEYAENRYADATDTHKAQTDDALESPRGLQRAQNLGPDGDHAEKQAD